MHRRSLLLSGGGTLAALPLAAPLATPASFPSDGIRVLDSYVTSRERFPDDPMPHPGATLRLKREPERRFDPLSIRVETTEGRPLGYLPGQSAQTVAILMDNGVAAEARAGTGGRLSVYLCTPLGLPTAV